MKILLPSITTSWRILHLAATGALLLIACAAPAANLLVNPGFEDNPGHNIPVGWTRFAPPNEKPYGDYAIEAPAHSGAVGWKQWGASYVVGVSNIAGIYQDFSGAPGSIYQASGWFYTKSTDTLGPNCRTWAEVSFVGASSNLLALYKSDDFTAAAGTDTWISYPVTNACDISSAVPSGDPYYTNTYAVTGAVTQLIAPAGTMTVRYRYAYLQANNEGGAAHFDDAVLDQISGPQPPVISDVFPLNMIFINPADGVSFRVRSPSGFTISPPNIGLVLNGSNVSSSLVITGSDSDKQVAYSGLLSNATYNVSITVTDSFGFTASTTTYFETTWVGSSPLVYLWEAEDWDFDGGQYINHPELCNVSGNPNCYFGKVGIEGVDEHCVTGGGNHLYRPDDAIATGIAGDFLRKNLAAAGRSDYRIDPFIGGSWLNYSRDWPNGTYWVVARLATGEGLSGSLTLSVVNPVTTNDLGTFTIASGRGWTSYDNILLKDTNGNPVAVTLNGKVTLRVTSGGNLLPNFFAIAPAQLDFPVLTGLYPTGTRPFEHTNALSFNITTVGATFPAGSIRLQLDGHDASSWLVLSGSSSNQQVVYPYLLPNATHTAIINVTNSLGNGLSRTNTFDTFSQDNYMVECEDYDYDGGQYVTDWLPGYYGGLGAVTNVDYQHSPIEGEQFLYRYEGIPQEVAHDYLRQLFVDWGATDYQLAWFGGGDWANYTRVYPTNTFFVYARSAGFGSYSMALDEVVVGTGTTNQTTRPLGHWGAVGKDNQTHAWVQLTDAGLAAPALVNLRGLGTLRLSTSTGNCHPSYLMFVPAVGIPLSAAKAGADVQVSFATQPGVVYRVFCQTSLASGDWTLLTTVLGNGAVRSVSDPAGGTQRYYKVVAP